MGILLCPTHGHQGFEEVCEHIYEDLEKEVVPEMKELPILMTKMCCDCFTKNKVEDFGNITLESILKLSEEHQMSIEIKLMSIYDNINRKGECIECLNKLLSIDASKKLPFKLYENTLMYKHNEEIEKLRSFLIANFKFQKIKDKSFSSLQAFTTISGAVSYPFSISFYYITSEEQQNQILKLIDTFFEKIPQKQRKISFYESDN